MVRHGSYLKYKQLLNKIIKKIYSVNVHMLISLLHDVVKFDLYIKTRKKTSYIFPMKQTHICTQYFKVVKLRPKLYNAQNLK